MSYTAPPKKWDKPIGRCPTCSVPCHHMDTLNMRCEECADGVVASTAAQDWRPCPACQQTGKSLILTAKGGDACPACHGSGWITADQIANARDELDHVVDALAYADYWPPEPAMVEVSKLGSMSLLRSQPAPGGQVRRELEAALATLDKEQFEARQNKEIKQMLAQMARDEAAPPAPPLNLGRGAHVR